MNEENKNNPEKSHSPVGRIERIVSCYIEGCEFWNGKTCTDKAIVTDRHGDDCCRYSDGPISIKEDGNEST